VLFGVTLATSVAQPTILIALPFLALVAALGVRGIGTVVAAGLAVLIVTAGAADDGFWFLERAWALVLGGWFAALTMRRPQLAFSTRAFASVAGTATVTAGLLAMRSGAWSSVDWAIRSRIAGGIGTALDALRVVRGGEALPAAITATVQQTIDTQTVVFPAMLSLASLSALGVAWWIYRRLSAGDDQGLGPLRDFRFNDHMVWFFIGGLVLVVSRYGDVLARVGANAVVFMGALYAVRGAAVILFLSGGLSFFGYALLALGLLFVPPLVLTGAMVIGIGDTWLDVRTRVRESAA
jgi:hypothetical protein